MKVPILFALFLSQAFGSVISKRFPPRKPPQCTTGVHIIATSGAANPPHGYGLLSSTVDNILAAIPDSTNYSVPYPKMDPDSAEAAAIGVDHETQYLEYFTSGCPDQPVVLLGYSLGAVVLLNTLCGRSHIGAPYSAPLSSQYAKYFIALIAYGDESRIPYQPYNKGTCIKGSGVNPRGNPYGCRAFQSVFQSYCDDGDTLCCNGNVPSVHKSYPGKYNDDATDYIVSQYNERMQKRGLLDLIIGRKGIIG